MIGVDSLGNASRKTGCGTNCPSQCSEARTPDNSFLFLQAAAVYMLKSRLSHRRFPESMVSNGLQCDGISTRKRSLMSRTCFHNRELSVYM
jgi:hypothetical protein